MAVRALLVGINEYQDRPLRGCVNDALAVRALLLQRFSVPDDQLRLLQDAQAVTSAIVDGLRWLAQPDEDGSPPVRLFHYSGHGLTVPDEDGDEPDGRDECIVPYDAMTAGAMTDDTLRAIYSSLAPDTHLLLTMDCCYSGTIHRTAQDIRYRFIPPSPEDEQRIEAAARAAKERITAAARGGDTSGAEWEQRIRDVTASSQKRHWGQALESTNVVLIAASRPDQPAADARFGDTYHGAFTYFLLGALREAGTGLTYDALIARLGRDLSDNKFRQVPQLDTSDENRRKGFLNLSSIGGS